MNWHEHKFNYAISNEPELSKKFCSGTDSKVDRSIKLNSNYKMKGSFNKVNQNILQ